MFWNITIIYNGMVLYTWIVKDDWEVNMKHLYAIIFCLSAMFAVGSIEDCGGACMGNENYLLAGASFVVMILSGIMTIKNQYN